MSVLSGCQPHEKVVSKAESRSGKIESSEGKMAAIIFKTEGGSMKHKHIKYSDPHWKSYVWECVCGFSTKIMSVFFLHLQREDVKGEI